MLIKSNRAALADSAADIAYIIFIIPTGTVKIDNAVNIVEEGEKMVV